MNETLKLLQNRKSVRKYSKKPVSHEDKQAILSAAMRAPTAGNMMLYSVIDVTDQKIKEKLAETCDHQPFIAKAPMVLVFCADYRRWMDKFASRGCGGKSPVRPEEGNLFIALSDALIAAQTAVVAAESLGMGSCYIGDILEQYETHAKLFKLPKYVVPVTMAVFGYPSQGEKNRRQPDRFPRETIVFENEYRRLAGEEIKKFASDINIEALYERKQSSDFMKEMNRSVRLMIKCWLDE